MKNLILKSWHKFLMTSTLVFVVIPAYATTTSKGNLPFVSSTETFRSNFQAWLLIAACILVSATFLMLAFGEWGDGIKRALNIIFWLSLSLGAITVITILFGTGATL